jgi:hypothetical protein
MHRLDWDGLGRQLSLFEGKDEDQVGQYPVKRRQGRAPQWGGDPP